MVFVWVQNDQCKGGHEYALWDSMQKPAQNNMPVSLDNEGRSHNKDATDLKGKPWRKKLFSAMHLWQARVLKYTKLNARWSLECLEAAGIVEVVTVDKACRFALKIKIGFVWVHSDYFHQKGGHPEEEKQFTCTWTCQRLTCSWEQPMVLWLAQVETLWRLT